MSDQEKVISKVKKLLAVANGNAAGGEHERDVAMKMAMNLLTKHNLDMADVNGSKDKEGRIQQQVIFRDEPWARSIAASVAEMMFCYVYVTRTHEGMVFTFIGLESNVETAKAMTEYLITSVAKESRSQTSKAGQTSGFKTSFRKGASQRIWERCSMLRTDAEVESVKLSLSTPGTGLVLADVYTNELSANKQYVANMGVTITPAKKTKSKPVGVAGYEAGRAFGDKVGLNKQIK